MSNKYPRMPHLPWSPGGTNDDKRLKTVEHFLNKELVITEKMDGSNLCMTRKKIFARSHSGPPTHKSFDLAKSVHASMKGKIDPGISVFGEWCYAVHSIEYDNLPNYFLVFGTRWDKDVPLEFDMLQPEGPFFWDFRLTRLRAHQLGLPTVPVLWTGKVNTEKELESLTMGLMQAPSVFGNEREGIVVRLERSFSEKDFRKSIAKCVRVDHPKDPNEHWMFKSIRKQGLHPTIKEKK